MQSTWIHQRRRRSSVVQRTPLCTSIFWLKEVILKESHDTLYSIHPEGTKMYQDLKEQFWWHKMKREIGSYIAKCDICQRVKAGHQRPTGLLQPLQIPEWKWDSLEWTLSPDCLLLVGEMTLFGS